MLRQSSSALLSRFGEQGTLFHQRKLFRVAQLWNPRLISSNAPFEDLDALPFITSADKQRLLFELPRYLTLAPSFTGDHKSLLQWFYRHRDQIPTWYSVGEDVALLLPSSAGAERIFSMVKAYFQWDALSLEESREARVMIRYNELQREKASTSNEAQENPDVNHHVEDRDVVVLDEDDNQAATDDEDETS